MIVYGHMALTKAKKPNSLKLKKKNKKTHIALAIKLFIKH